ncbi:MAG: ATPase [Anaerococcus sp.]|nr:ATPase [Anaerococcus sp.]
MLDLEAKLSSFRKMVWGEEKERSEKDLYSSTEINSKLIADKKDQLDKALKESLRNRRSFAEIRKNERLSKKEFDGKNDLYIYRQDLLDDLIARIKEKLIRFTDSQSYKNSLEDKINDSLKTIGLSKEDTIIGLVGKDLDLVNFPHKEKLDDKYIGGYLISDKNREFRYNFTFDNKLKERKYEVGKKLNQLLESEPSYESKN